MSASYDVKVVEIRPMSLASVHEVAWAQNIGPKILATSPIVYARLADLSVSGIGHNVVVYHAGCDARWDVAPGIPIEVAVELTEPLARESAPVVRSSTPAGRAATTRHFGPYHDLPQAHMAVHAWCHEQGLGMTGLNWELYGDDTEDPSQLITDVFYQLK